MLRHSLATLLMHNISINGGVLALPYVVMRESSRHLVEKLERAVQAAEKGLGEIRQLVGEAPEVGAFESVDMAAEFVQRLEEFGDLIELSDASPEQFQRAGEMVLSGDPPSKPKNQQFKDSLLWQEVLILAETDDVKFVTNDSGFLNADRSALADSLSAQVQAAGLSIEVHADIESLLRHWGQEEDPEDKEIVEEQLRASARLAIDRAMLSVTTFDLGPEVDANFDYFATEPPGTVYVAADLEYELVDMEFPEMDARGIVTARVSATYEAGVLEVSDVSVDELSVDLLTPHADIHLGGFVAVSSSGGSSDVQIRRYNAMAPLRPL